MSPKWTGSKLDLVQSTTLHSHLQRRHKDRMNVSSLILLLIALTLMLMQWEGVAIKADGDEEEGNEIEQDDLDVVKKKLNEVEEPWSTRIMVPQYSLGPPPFPDIDNMDFTLHGNAKILKGSVRLTENIQSQLVFCSYISITCLY